jgi:hypothetical protein
MILIGARAAYYTPIDTSTLINSQFREIDAGGVLITGHRLLSQLCRVRA